MMIPETNNENAALPMKDPQDILIDELDRQPEDIKKMLIRRAIRMIFGTEVNQADEIMFNNWRISQNLKPLDENNQPT